MRFGDATIDDSALVGNYGVARTVTDVVHAIPLAIFAGLGHLLIGNVDFGLLGNLLLGSIPAVIVGAMLSARPPHALLRGVLAVVLLSIGLKLWWSVTA